MNCFIHDENPAVGCCRNCAKAVCRECLFYSEFPVGVVCSAECKSRVDRLLETLKDGESAKTEFEKNKEQVAEDRWIMREQIRENNLLKAKNVQLYLNLARQERLSFILCSVISFSLFGYCGIYAKFFDWYFAMCLAVLLLVSAFNSFHKSEAFRKWAAEES